ncbi:TPA: hypothetical protein OUB66_001422 [Corynebacterium aurimucosum]|nr:hypothetical protein [Corynebacterium aurimucosum]
MATSKPHKNGSGDSDAGPARISSAATKSEEKAWSWVLALFGTAMDAGILFPPLQAGSFGKISVLSQGLARCVEAFVPFLQFWGCPQDRPTADPRSLEQMNEWA